MQSMIKCARATTSITYSWQPEGLGEPKQDRTLQFAASTASV